MTKNQEKSNTVSHLKPDAEQRPTGDEEMHPRRLTDISNIRLSLTQVVAVAAVVAGATYFLEDRYANKASVDADMDAIKSSLVSHIQTQTKMTNEMLSSIQWMQYRLDEYEREDRDGNRIGPKSDASRKPPVTTPALKPDAHSPELLLPERLFVDSSGKPIVALPSKP
ncbi:hypothetical protein GR11A_00125 [Vibrio phage vB_VcorM_GR11A]|nr:hypothetical protein GR11A_00125 [Vibrio phage vB_VcorM_GR11A]